MHGYAAAGLGILLALAATGAGEGTATAPAAQVGDAAARYGGAQQRLWRLLGRSQKGDDEAIAELTASRRQLEQHLLDMLADGPAQRHSALIAMRDAPKGAPALRGIVATPELVDAVALQLRKMLQVRAKDWGEAASRCVACEVLGMYGNRNHIPVLLTALDEPFMHHDMAPAPVGAEHIYRTIWWDADEAMRKITAASPLPRPAQHVGPEDTDRIAARRAWRMWWEANDTQVPIDQQIGKWSYRLRVSPDSSTTRWTFGQLHYAGRPIPVATTGTPEAHGTFMWTPWGRLIWHDRGSMRGWLPHSWTYPPPDGREMASPDPHTSGLVRQRWETLRKAGEAFCLHVTYSDGKTGGSLELSPTQRLLGQPPPWKLWWGRLPLDRVPTVVDRLAVEGMLARAGDPRLIRVRARRRFLEVGIGGGEGPALVLGLEPTPEAVRQLQRVVRCAADETTDKQVEAALDALAAFVTREPAGPVSPATAPDDRNGARSPR
ncbi:MAG TPA: hypothetical protein VM389_10360 [Phycisphaerae bacterium]|nr:hypothetical protein [Phycisphaerae bacterium]